MHDVNFEVTCADNCYSIIISNRRREVYSSFCDVVSLIPGQQPFILNFHNVTQKAFFSSFFLALSVELPRIRAMEFQSCSFDHHDLIVLLSVLRKHNPHNFQALSFTICQLGSEGLRVLAQAFRNEEWTLEKLTLKMDLWSQDSMREFLQVLPNAPRLTTLSISIHTDCFDQLACTLPFLLVLDTLSLDDSHLENNDEEEEASSSQFVRFVTVIPHTPLQRLRLENLPIGDENVSVLMRECVLSPCCRLTVLGLINCNITSGGVCSIVQYLRSPMCTLQELLLGFNEIDDEGALSLALFLSSSLNHLLSTLALNDNRIHVTGAQALLKAVCKSSVTCLWLCRNSFALNQVVPEVSMALKLSKLCRLELPDDDVLPVSMALLASALRHPYCNKIQVFHVGSEEDETVIQSILAQVKVRRNMLSLVTASACARLGLASSMKRFPVDLFGILFDMLAAAEEVKMES